MGNNNKVYNTSQKTYNIGDNKNRNYVGRRVGTAEMVPFVKNLTLKDIANFFKDLDEYFRLDGDCVVLYTGRNINNKEIELKFKPLDEKFVIIETDDEFGVYLENNYTVSKARNMILPMIDRKNHKGIMGFDEEKWCITSICPLDVYVYDKWVMAEIVEDVCCDILDD